MDVIKQFIKNSWLITKHYDIINNLLNIHTSSAPSERVFSRAKLIQQRQRWNLLPQCLEACVMLKHNAGLITSIYLDSKRAVCITACYVSQTQFLYL